MSKITVDKLNKIREQRKAQISNPDIIRILICGGTGCHATGSIKVK
ncbi:MAG: hypothetical protein GY707_13690, partial [Desulfobacteraceae bacterium]|nr:hypothetical protein [Desulfobacteraceae bacterium]